MSAKEMALNVIPVFTYVACIIQKYRVLENRNKTTIIGIFKTRDIYGLCGRQATNTDATLPVDDHGGGISGGFVKRGLITNIRYCLLAREWAIMPLLIKRELTMDATSPLVGMDALLLMYLLFVRCFHS